MNWFKKSNVKNCPDTELTTSILYNEATFYSIGPQVLLIRGGHHRKLAMIDRKILWEGSLNILSQSRSREFMRRIESRKLTEELFQFVQFDRLDLFRKNLDLL